MYFIFFYGLINLGDLTFTYFQKFLAVELKPIDHLLVWFSPLLFTYPIIKYKLNYPRQLLRMTLMGIGTTLLSLVGGIVIGLFTWGNDQSSPFLPEYLLVQPFGNYWTVFIVLGIVTPIAVVMLQHGKNTIREGTID
ncbi:hypothetical protein N9Y29_01845 [Crocinitomicaceae bacterium]|nr:hypothetical protein [Crocinitomicaceae bacterium]